ncbi:MAR-binding filament protein [Salix suchowensis]|nr:MAR-binding filament protein [Salix suchowensis]
MKRTISGMLGLLPSDRFQVFIEAWWESLSMLLVSSMMTGYTLRNAEYRLCLERNLDIHEEDFEMQVQGNSKTNLQGLVLEGEKSNQSLGKDTEFEKNVEDLSDDINIQGLGEISLEAQQYILHLQSHYLLHFFFSGCVLTCLLFPFSFLLKELHEVRMKSAALQMQQFVSEEKNDLLDYLRSLQPEKVAELSEPTFPELKETIHSVVHGLLATLSPKMHSKTPPQSENTSPGSLNIGVDCAELVENTSLHFHPLISLTRDYLARLLFWCMLLGHYMRGLEYRMELTELLSLTSHEENDSCEDRQVA